MENELPKLTRQERQDVLTAMDGLVGDLEEAMERLQSQGVKP